MLKPNALDARDSFFKPVSLYDSWFCVDDRGHNLSKQYVKIPGGVGFLATVMACVDLKRGVTITDIRSYITKIANEAEDSGLKIGIHSDNNHGFNSSGIGCGYISKRQGIMTAASGKSEVIAATSSSLMPNLESINVALDSYGQLTQSGLYTDVTPKEIADTAVNNGTPTMLVFGEHNPDSIGVINLKKDTTYDNNEAIQKSLPAYCYDHWAFMEGADLIPSLAKQDRKLQESIAITDAVATFMYLGIEPENIFVRN